MRNRLTKILAGLAALTALALGGSAIAGATSGGGSSDGENEAQLSSSEAAKAGAAALRATSGGTVQASERDNEKGATFEVEVRKPDGSVVDVRLDSSYGVIAVDDDQETNDDNGGQNEDAGEN